MSKDFKATHAVEVAAAVAISPAAVLTSWVDFPILSLDKLI